MDMVGKIRRLHGRGNKSEREIARITGLSRNTVAKWLKGSVGDAPRYRRGPMAVKLTPFAVAIEQALEADAHRPRKDRRTGKALHKEISAAGYAGGYSRLTDFIREWRARREGAGTAGAFVPLAFEMGDAFQFDWSEEALVIGGIYRKLQVSHMKLCASRAFWLVAYPSQGHEMLFDAHTRSFAALGGIARRGIYDNMKTAVDKVKKGKGRVVNARFAVMCAHYLYDPDFCIYNDVFVHERDGSIAIYGYPESVFPPTDSHTATLVGDAIYVIGSIGYMGTRRYGETPVYRLDVHTLRMDRLHTTGDSPGWTQPGLIVRSSIPLFVW